MYETCKRHLAGVVGLECSQKILMMVDDRMGPWCFRALPGMIFDVSWFQVAKILRERSIFADTSQAWWMTSHSELQRLVVELEVSFWGLLNYESDGSTTNLNSCKVFFSKNELSKGVSSDAAPTIQYLQSVIEMKFIVWWNHVLVRCCRRRFVDHFISTY